MNHKGGVWWDMRNTQIDLIRSLNPHKEAESLFVCFGSSGKETNTQYSFLVHLLKPHGNFRVKHLQQAQKVQQSNKLWRWGNVCIWDFGDVQYAILLFISMDWSVVAWTNRGQMKMHIHCKGLILNIAVFVLILYWFFFLYILKSHVEE